MNSLKISIIIPCYKSKSINRTLASIEAAFHSAEISYEVLLCIYDKNDSTFTYLDNSYKCVHVVYSKRPGVTANRNAGIIASKGDFIYFLDSDDTVLENFFDTFNKLTNTSFDMAYVGGINFSCKKGIDKYLTINNYDLFFSDREIIQFSYCTYFFKRSFIINNRLFVDDSITNSEDYLFIAMCLDKKPLLIVSPFTVFKYAISENSLSKRCNLDDCIVSFKSFKLLFELLEKNKMSLSIKRYAQIFVTSVLDKPLSLDNKDRGQCVICLKGFHMKKYIWRAHKSIKTVCYLLFGYRITWKILNLKRISKK